MDSVYRRFKSGYAVMLNFGAKKCKKKTKNTQQYEIAEETEFLPISQKSHFPIIDYRFWKLYGASIWDQKCASLGREAQGCTLQTKISQFCNRKFHSITHTSGLSAKVWNLNNTVSMRKNIPENVSKLSNLWFKRTKISLDSKKCILQSGTNISVLKAL